MEVAPPAPTSQPSASATGEPVLDQLLDVVVERLRDAAQVAGQLAHRAGPVDRQRLHDARPRGGLERPQLVGAPQRVGPGPGRLAISLLEK